MTERAPPVCEPAGLARSPCGRRVLLVPTSSPTPMTTSRRARLLAAATLLLAACAPVVTHGPRVDPGMQLTLTAGTVRPLCDSGCTGGQLPTMGGGLRYGFTPERPELPAFLAGVSVPVFDVAAPELDLYVQGPHRDRSWGYGAGVLSSPRHLMPYVQVGHTPIHGTGWYFTGGYARLNQYDSWWDAGGDEPVRDHHRRPRYWTPTLALRLPRGEGTLDLYVSGAFGHYVDNVVTSPPFDSSWPGSQPEVTRVRKPVRMLTAGVILNADLGRLGENSMRFPRRFPGMRDEAASAPTP